MYAQNPVPPDPTGSNPPPGDQVPSPGDPVIGKVELPPAAKTVLTGTKTERETTLEAELQTERNSHAKTAEEKKKRELRIAELEDELHRLKSPPAPKKKAGLLDLNEFFDE